MENEKLLSTVLSASMLITGLTACAADDETVLQTEGMSEDISISMQIDNPIMRVNDVETEIDEGRGTAPVIVNDRTLVPIRAIIEAMGGTVSWEQDTQTATLNYESNEIRLVIDSTTAYLNDEPSTIDTAPAVINDRTMLPIRFIAESFEFDVDWDETTRTVTIAKAELAEGEEIASMEDGMVLIQGGTFVMGSPANEPERENDEIQHEVTVSDFYMSPTEVTQAEYFGLMGNNPSENDGENAPVENVTWYDAVNYCNALSRANGLDEVYTVSGDTVTWNKEANGYRLPTEAEWEYAARANTTTPFSFGDYVHDDDANCYNAYGYNNDATGNWVNGYIGNTVDVDNYNANGFGMYNMHGNVAEWVWDWYSDYDTTDVNDPTGPESGSYKVARGGGWNDQPKHIRSAYRGAHPADVPFYAIGIRVVRNAQPETSTLTSTFTRVEEKEDKNVLIAYFSQTGNTEGLTEIIAEMTGADVFHIERATLYSAAHNSQSLYGEALDELRTFAVPELRTSLEEAGYNIDDYDTILLGYCNWWASIPAPVRSFLTEYDMSGKTIIPYCSMGGGRFGQTISAIAKLDPNSNIKEGLDVSYSSYDRDRIREWLTDNGIDVR